MSRRYQVLIGHAFHRSITEAQKQDLDAIYEIVQLLADKIGKDVECFSAGFPKDLEDLFDSFKAQGLISSFILEHNEHYFGVDFVLSGAVKAQSIFGSLVEMTIEEVDEILGVTGRPVKKKNRSIN
jgi:hypothetical protein